MRGALCALAVAAVLPLAGCGAGPPDTGSGTGTVTVFAAASLTESMSELGRAFEATRPGVTVQTSFAGSQTLVAQVQQGAPADLVVTADEASLAQLADELDGPPEIVARNALSIVVEPGNAEQVRTLADLGRPGLAVVLAGPDVPVGASARAALNSAGVQVRPVSEEPDVKAVLAKVRLGEADAGIVYRTDVTAASDTVDGIALPGVSNSYPAAVVRGAGSLDLAQALLGFLLSPDGQRILASFGFLPPG